MFDSLFRDKTKMVDAADALPGRQQEMPLAAANIVLNTPMKGDIPAGYGKLVVALGCFWGAERVFWKLPGVWTTAVGYIGGYTTNPTYEEVCTGRTGHTEGVLVVYDPDKISLAELLKVFWESHDPTQGMRQGNDVGTQYRSAVYAYGEEDLQIVEASRAAYAEALSAKGLSAVTTEIAEAPTFYYAEDYHQQYLQKNPNGYCGIGGTGVTCPLPVTA